MLRRDTLDCQPQPWGRFNLFQSLDVGSGVFRLSAGLLAVCFLSLRCSPDAPHSNPLDPAAPGFSRNGSITGKVLTLNDPRQPVASALVKTGAGSASVTGSDGSFQILNLPVGQAIVIASKNGFRTDTSVAAISIAQSTSIEIHLDALPTVPQASVVMQKIDQWWPGPVYSVFVTATILDSDGAADIETTFVSVGTLSFPLKYSATDKNFQAAITPLQLPTNNVQWLVGKPLSIVARDLSGGTTVQGGIYVTRILEEEATPLFPVASDTTSVSPLLQWNAPSVTFYYTYVLEIVLAGTQLTIWRLSGLPSYTRSYQYPSTLLTGNYFWTISVVDQYGNSARSKESSFVVP